MVLGFTNPIYSHRLSRAPLSFLMLILICLLPAWKPVPDDEDLLRLHELSTSSMERLRPSYEARSLDELLMLEDERIDIAAAAFLVASEFDGKIDVREGLEKVDRITAAILKAAPEAVTPEQALRMVHAHLFKDFEVQNTDRRIDGFLSTVLSKGRGHSIGITTLYLAVGRRMGLPLFLVRTAMGYFPRYVDGEKGFDIDLGKKGDTAVHEINKDEYTTTPLRAELSDLLVNRGLAWKDSGQHVKAMADYEQASKIDSGNFVCYLCLGMGWYSLGDYDQSIVAYSRAIDIRPDYAIAYYDRLFSWEKKGEFEKAMADLDRAIQLEPDDPDYLHARAVRFENRGEYDKALADIDRAIGINPENAALYLVRGDVWYRKEDYIKVLKDATRAVELAPGWALTYFYRGLALLERWEYEKAIADFTKALELDSTMVAAFYHRGRARYTLNYRSRELEGAVVDFSQYLKHVPGDVDGLNERGRAKLRWGKVDEAIGDFTHALEVDPARTDVFWNRAEAWHEKGELGKAFADYSRILAISPESTYALLHQGRIRHEMGDSEQAIKDLTKFIQREPNETSAYIHRGKAWYELGEFGQAEADFTQALDKNEVNAEAKCWRGLAREKLGEDRKALSDFNWVLSIAPDSEQASAARAARQRVFLRMKKGRQARGSGNGDRLDLAMETLRNIDPRALSEEEKSTKAHEISISWEILVDSGEEGYWRLKQELTRIEEKKEDDDFFKLAAAALLWDFKRFDEAGTIAGIFETVDLSLQYNYVFQPAFQAAASRDERALPIMKASLRTLKADYPITTHAMTLAWPQTADFIWGVYGPQGFPVLAKLLDTSDETAVLESAMHLLAVAQWMEALPAIRKLARCENNEVRRMAIKCLGVFGHPRDFEFLIQCLDSEDTEEIWSAVFALYEFGDLRAVPQLVPFLASKDERLRRETLAALYHLAAPEGLVAVHEHAEKASGGDFKAYCKGVVNRLLDEMDLDWERYVQMSEKEKSERLHGLHGKREENFRMKEGDRTLTRDGLLKALEYWKDKGRLGGAMDAESDTLLQGDTEQLKEVAAKELDEDQKEHYEKLIEDMVERSRKAAEGYGWIEAKHVLAVARAEDLNRLQDVRAVLYERLSDECLYEVREIDKIIRRIGRTRYRKHPGVCSGVEEKE